MDSSAIIAILKDEPEAAELLTRLSTEPAFIPAPTLLETSIVARPHRQHEVDTLIRAFQIGIIDFTADHAEAARAAHARFGRGSGSPARLNYGDCMAYAVAKVRGEPLLFKGDDFTHTDIESPL